MAARTSLRIPLPVNPVTPEWECNGAAFVWLGAQRTEAWHALRAGRLGSSSVGAVLQHSRFETPLEVSERMAGVRASKPMNDAMRRGVENEDNVRLEYERASGNVVREVGIALRARPYAPLQVDGTDEPGARAPFPEHLIAVSPDGLVGDEGMIEIKYAVRPYAPLVRGCETRNLVQAHERGDFKALREFIWSSHYDQMQLAMVTLGRKWCDYVVKDDETKTLRIVRVPIDVEYWNTQMLPGLTHFFTVHAEVVRAANEAALRASTAGQT